MLPFFVKGIILRQGFSLSVPYKQGLYLEVIFFFHFLKNCFGGYAGS